MLEAKSGLLTALVLCIPFVFHLPVLARAMSAHAEWLMLLPPGWFVGFERVLLGSFDPWLCASRPLQQPRSSLCPRLSRAFTSCFSGSLNASCFARHPYAAGLAPDLADPLSARLTVDGDDGLSENARRDWSIDENHASARGRSCSGEFVQQPADFVAAKHLDHRCR